MKYPNTLAGKKKLYMQAKEAYFNSDAIMSDAEFDRLEDLIRTEVPTWKALKKTGVPVRHKKTKLALSHFMPSLHKAYPDKFPKWCAKQKIANYLVMDKLDGCSLLVDYLDGRPYQICTRGSGIIGGNVSYLAKHLNLPQQVADKTPFSVRCEGVMKKKVFASKYKDKYENARGLVNGLFNRALEGEASPVFKDVDIVVLGVFMKKMEAGLDFATKHGFTVVPHTTTPDVKNIGKALASRKTGSPYEVDGLVVCAADALFMYSSDAKPAWAIAFKDNNEDEEAIEVHVKRIIYQISPRSRIVPKIEIVPIRIGGVTVKYCTCHNAKWMKDRGIGPGAICKLVRSGGVIPKIVGVVKPSKFQPPEVPYKLQGVNFVVDKSAGHEASARRVEIMEVKKFLNTFRIDNIAIKTIEVLYAAGCTTPFHYMKLAVSGKVEPMIRAGVGKANAVKIMAELEAKLCKVTLSQLMVASNKFGVGVGDRRLSMIQDSGLSMARLLLMNKGTAMATLVKIPSFKTKTAQVVVDGIKPFNDFLAKAKRIGIEVYDRRPEKKAPVKGGKLSGQRVAWTGYRSKEEEAAVEAAGGEVAKLDSKTTILLYNPDGKFMDKVEKAAARGVKTVLFKDLKL